MGLEQWGRYQKLGSTTGPEGWYGGEEWTWPWTACRKTAVMASG
jgi:hypothetical protein